MGNVQVIENIFGGNGSVILEPLLNEEQLNGKCGLYAKCILNTDCSLGHHEHKGETETYFILSGKGQYEENGVKSEVKVGDVVFCKDGNGHSIGNVEKEPLVFMALVIMS